MKDGRSLGPCRRRWREDMRPCAASFDGYVPAAIDGDVFLVFSRQHANFAAGGGQVIDGCLNAGEITMTMNPIADSVGTTRREFGQGLKNAAAVFDSSRGRGRPRQLSQRHTVIMNALRRLMIDEGGIVRDLAGAN